MAKQACFRLLCDSCGRLTHWQETEEIMRDQASYLGWTESKKHGDLCPRCRESNYKGVSQ